MSISLLLWSCLFSIKKYFFSFLFSLIFLETLTGVSSVACVGECGVCMLSRKGQIYYNGFHLGISRFLIFSRCKEAKLM